MWYLLGALVIALFLLFGTDGCLPKIIGFIIAAIVLLPFFAVVAEHLH